MLGFRTSTQPTNIKHLAVYNFQGRNPTNRMGDFSFNHYLAWCSTFKVSHLLHPHNAPCPLRYAQSSVLSPFYFSHFRIPLSHFQDSHFRIPLSHFQDSHFRIPTSEFKSFPLSHSAFRLPDSSVLFSLPIFTTSQLLIF